MRFASMSSAWSYSFQPDMCMGSRPGFLQALSEYRKKLLSQGVISPSRARSMARNRARDRVVERCANNKKTTWLSGPGTFITQSFVGWVWWVHPLVIVDIAIEDHHFSMETSTISMAIFNSFLYLYQRLYEPHPDIIHRLSTHAYTHTIYVYIYILCMHVETISWPFLWSFSTAN